MFDRLRARLAERRLLDALTLGEYPRAEALLQALQEREGESQRVLRNLGLVRMAQGDLAEARRLFEREVELFGPSADRLRALAEVAYLAGDRQSAASRIAAALSEPGNQGSELLGRRARVCADPQAHAAAMRGKKDFAEGNRRLAAGDTDGALASFQRAAAGDPTDYAALNNIGGILMNDRNDPAAAIRNFEQARALLDLPMVRANLARARAMMEKSKR
jgi:Tfp pilus assembly protein PilF